MFFFSSSADRPTAPLRVRLTTYLPSSDIGPTDMDPFPSFAIVSSAMDGVHGFGAGARRDTCVQCGVLQLGLGTDR